MDASAKAALMDASSRYARGNDGAGLQPDRTVTD
jgi:hypothetical protein